MHKESLWFCFNHIIQSDLDFVKLHWNTHYIRPSRHETKPGRPDELFFLPERSGGHNQLQPVTDAKLAEIGQTFEAETTAGHSQDYQDYFAYFCNEMGITRPSGWREAVGLFNQLKTLEESGN